MHVMHKSITKINHNFPSFNLSSKIEVLNIKEKIKTKVLQASQKQGTQ